MSGVTEVRLYFFIVDAVPADYADVTAEVLNSAATDHGAGIKRSLDGAATVSGLGGGTTNYFWWSSSTPAATRRGRSPQGATRRQRCGVLTLRFHRCTRNCFSLPFRARSGGGAVFADTWRPYEGEQIYTDENDLLGGILWTIADDTNSFAPVFNVDLHRS
jgi:hypothetical protein